MGMNHIYYHQNLPDLLYYYINSDNKWYEVFWYVYKYVIYTHIYPSTHDVRVQIILSKHVLVHIRDGNDELMCLQYVSHSLQHIHHIRNENIIGCK